MSAIVIGRDGQGRRVRIPDTTTNASDADKKRLVELIEHSAFRPRVIDGQFARAAPVVLRYYLTELRTELTRSSVESPKSGDSRR